MPATSATGRAGAYASHTADRDFAVRTCGSFAAPALVNATAGNQGEKVRMGIQK